MNCSHKHFANRPIENAGDIAELDGDTILITPAQEGQLWLYDCSSLNITVVCIYERHMSMLVFHIREIWKFSFYRTQGEVTGKCLGRSIL